MPSIRQPIAADVKAVYVHSSCRRIHRLLVKAGPDGLAHLGRFWPDLADELRR
jgi:hypothetical protein